jgi:hypothetical protein
LRYIFHSVWLQYKVTMTFLIELKEWRRLETYFMIETAEFFSFHFIALSRPPPSWTGCSQSVRSLVVFDRSAHLCINSPEGALCVQLSVFILSFDGFLSRHPLLVHHLLAWGHCPPMLCLFGRTAVSRPDQLASRVSNRWCYLSYFSSEKVFCYGSATPHPYPVRSLPAQLWHRCTDGVFMWTPTQPWIIGWAEIRTRVSQLRCRCSNHYSTSSGSEP